MSHYIIDGYNLLLGHFLPLGEGEELEEQREALCHRLQQFARRAGHRITIVFDGKSGTRHRKSSFRNVEVLYSAAGKEADDVIQDWIRRQAASQKLVVVSSDQKIRNTARDHGAQVISSREFAQQLSQMDQKAAAIDPPSEVPEKFDPDLDPDEIERWKALFSRKSDPEE